jgi:hypothetical protein
VSDIARDLREYACCEQHSPYLVKTLIDAADTCERQQQEIERLRAFAKRVYRSEDSPAWAHDAVAKLLDLPGLCHGCGGEAVDEQ